MKRLLCRLFGHHPSIGHWVFEDFFDEYYGVSERRGRVQFQCLRCGKELR